MARFVEGRDRRQIALLPDCLDDYATDDNPVRVVDAFIDELDLAAWFLGLPKMIREIAWKTQIRLCGRYRRLCVAGKKLPS